MKEKIVARIKSMKREQMIVFLLLIGIVIVISIPVQKEPAKKEGSVDQDYGITEAKEGKGVDDQTQNLEEMLEDTLRQVEGVGEVAVAITMESTGEKIVEKDIPENNSTTIQEDSQGGKQESTVQSGEESTVYVQDGEGNQTPYVVSETAPEIRGVIVVAGGGDVPVVAQQIQEAVQALFHVEAHKIKVMKMK
jgi:stage III sporulation protein AG